MCNVLQSAHSFILKVHNDVALNMDKGKVTALTFPDLSAAFDTIDHNILIKHLSMWYGIYGTTLSWFSSYFIHRYQRMKIANCFSCSVPRGSFLGPLLFTLYSTPLNSVIQTYNLDHHLYAGDTQIYLSLATPDTNCSLNQLRDCLQNVFHWMTNSKLKLIKASKRIFICSIFIT